MFYLSISWYHLFIRHISVSTECQACLKIRTHFATSEHLLLPACSVAAGTLAATSHQAILFLPSSDTHLAFTHGTGLWVGWLKTEGVRQLVPEANEVHEQRPWKSHHHHDFPATDYLCFSVASVDGNHEKPSVSLLTELPPGM